jgi:signal transduction histidine kinase
MLKYISWVVPRRISSQIAALIAGSILLHLIVLSFVATFYNVDDNPAVLNHPTVVRAMMVMKMIVNTPDPIKRAELFNVIVKVAPSFRLENYKNSIAMIPKGPGEVNNETGWTNIEVPRIQAELGVKFLVGLKTYDDTQDLIVIAFENGFAMSFLAPTEMESEYPASFRMITLLGSFAIVLMVISIWAANRLGSPLSRLAHAASKFDADQPFAAIQETGPTEVVKVARAFNEMGKRTSQLVEDRTHMIAAVSHDLRTPITRLRLRTEYVDNKKIKKQMQGDLNSMNRMVQSALTYVKTMRLEPELKAVDLTSLLQSLCDDYADLEQPVSFEPHKRFPILCDEDQVKRAVTNIIENALEFKAKVIVHLSETVRGMIDILITDDGPGIQDDKKQSLLKPFQRGDDGRGSGKNEGFGLGLSICSAIVAAHRGRIILEDAKPHGLVVIIRLPSHE